MKPNYIILLGQHRADLDERLKNSGMTRVVESRQAKLFVSSHTPVHTTRSSGRIIGDVFTRDGKQIHNFPDRTPHQDLHRHLLDHCWGGYVSAQLHGQHICLLRDPSGAVPCVYSFDGQTGFITSDIDLAINLGIYRRHVDWNAIIHRLQFPYLKTSQTALGNVQELLPGCQLDLTETGLHITSSWTPWSFVVPECRHVDRFYATESIANAVTASVKALAGRVDSLIVELSGGLDSSIISVCLGENSDKAVFTTLVMPSAGADERHYARLVTEMLGQPLVPIMVGFDNVRYEFPVQPSSTQPDIGILQNAVNNAWEAAGDQHGINSYFSGGGGDSIFCYIKTAAPAADAYKECGLMTGIKAIQDLSNLHQCTLWKAARLTLKKIAQNPRLDWKADTSLLNTDRLLPSSQGHPWMHGPQEALPGDREKIHDLIGTQLFRDMASRGGVSATHFPLLTQPVVEACLRAPTWMWISGGRNRSLARDAFARQLPPKILDRRDKGSYTGYLGAVFSRNKAGMQAFLEEGLLMANGIVDRRKLSEYFRGKQMPQDISFIRIFDLCAAENWVRQQNS